MPSNSVAEQLSGEASQNGQANKTEPKEASSMSAPKTPRLRDLPAKQLWHRTAAAALTKAWKTDPAKAGWKELRKQLRKNGSSKLVNVDSTNDKDSGAKSITPLLWGVCLSDPQLSQLFCYGFDDWYKRQNRLIANANSEAKLAAAVEAWVEQSGERTTSPLFGLECITWAYALPVIADRLKSDLWWRLCEQLELIARQAQDWRSGDDAPCADMITQQLLAGELGLTLACVLPPCKPLRNLGKPAANALTEGLLAATDGEGLPPGRALSCLGLIAGCWTRCRAWTKQTGERCWDAAAETQYEWLVRQMIRLARPDGTLALSRGKPATQPTSLLATALGFAGDESDEAAAALRLKKIKLPARRRTAAPDPSVNSEWSGVSVLSAGWTPDTPQLTVNYDNLTIDLELIVRGKPVLSGAWESQVSIDGSPVEIAGSWEEQCWYSDEDCDYLELAIALEDGSRLERLMLLARNDEALMLSDVLFTKRREPVGVEVETRLPFADGVQFNPEDETRDGWLTLGKKNMAGVLPISLAEWRADPRFGELSADGNQLLQSRQAAVRTLCSPLWFDLKAKRFAKQRTWRQLTVAHGLQPVAQDVAVGYRVQSGKDQWLMYRSLDEAMNRSVLGQNLSSEALVGRILPDGDVEEYYEIEKDD